jgi:RimJ/RimL family protein N-acetyltransferase
VEIRVLTPDDAEAYWVLRLEALETVPRAFSASVSRHRERGPQGVASMLQSEPNGSFTLGAFNGGELVGIMGMSRDTNEKTRHGAFVFGVYVADSARKLGVGSKLMETLVARARTCEGLERLVLHVDSASPAAMRLYEKLGFHSFGLEKHAMKVNGEYVDLHHMAIDL